MAKQQKRHQFNNNNPKSKKNPNFSEFASLVKALFQILQCIHHIGLLKGHIRDQSFPDSITRKISDLNNFLKPGQRNAQIDRAIDQVNKTWANNIIQEMIAHYESCLLKLKAQVTLAKSSKSLDFDRAFSNAVKWGKQNFRHKLLNSTLTTFESFVRSIKSRCPGTSSVFPISLVPSTPIIHSPTPSSSTSSSTPSPQPEPSCPSPPPMLTPSTPPRTSPPSPHAGPSRLSPSPQPGPSSQSLPSPPTQAHSPRRPGRSYSDALRSPPKIQKKIKSNRIENNTFWKFRRSGSDKNVLPTVNKKILLIGDSNLSRINLDPHPDMQVACYPGANFNSFQKLVQNYKGPQPEILILNVGINNKDTPKPIPQLRNMMRTLRQTFPKSLLYFVELQSSSKISALTELNAAAANSNKVKIIPKFPMSKFRVCPDRVHWTEVTANSLYLHWLKHFDLN